MLKALLDKFKRSRDPVKYWRSLGATIGEGCEIYSSASLGSEPYLITVGDRVRISSNVQLVTHDGAAFRMLIHEVDYTAPAWFGEGVMYHVFVDRFCRGEGETHRRTGKRAPEINPDWENGIPQYPAYPGAHLTNHIHFGGNLWAWRRSWTTSPPLA